MDVHGEETHDDGLGEERDDKDGLLADAVRDGAVHDATEQVEARVDQHNVGAEGRGLTELERVAKRGPDESFDQYEGDKVDIREGKQA